MGTCEDALKKVKEEYSCFWYIIRTKRQNNKNSEIRSCCRQCRQILSRSRNVLNRTVENLSNGLIIEKMRKD